MGTDRVSDNLKKYQSFKDARKFARSLNLKSQKEWFDYCKSGKKPDDIPRRVNSSNHYKNEWISWGDFLGTGRLAHKDLKLLPFKKARGFVRKLELKNLNEWTDYCKSGEKPQNIPAGPALYYKGEGWVNLGDWLGTGRVSNRNIPQLSYEETKKLISKLKFKNRDEFQNFASQYNLRNKTQINSNPHRKFKSQWNGWSKFLGTGRKRGNIFLPFKESRVIARGLGLKNYKDWLAYVTSDKRNLNIPSDPRRKYSNDWISWDDFLGND